MILNVPNTISLAALIHQSSHLFSKIIAAEHPNELIKLFKVAASPFWDGHYTFDAATHQLKKNIGKAAIENLIINTIVPFLPHQPYKAIRFYWC